MRTALLIKVAEHRQRDKPWPITRSPHAARQSVNETLLKLERLEEEAIAENDRRIWLEVIKYRNKIRGGEIERSEVKVTGNIQLNWGSDPGLQKLESKDDDWQQKM